MIDQPLAGDYTQARLEGVTITARQVAHLLNNELAPALTVFALLQDQPDLPPDLRRLVSGAADHLGLALRSIGLLQRVVRVETRETPLGPALDLERCV